MTKLFDEFSPNSDQEWIEKISKDLKGKTADEIARKRPYEGIDLKVFYTKKDSGQSLGIDILGHWDISSEVEFRESVLADPIHHLLTAGNWVQDEQTDLSIFVDLCKTVKDDKRILVNGSLYQLAGASATFELACIIAHLNEYLHLLKEEKLLEKNCLDKLTISMALGSDYFMQIAKMRALRILVKNLAEAYKIDTSLRFELYAENGLSNFSSKDMDTNILRSTTACMAAVIGGCDKLIIQPHDALNHGMHVFGERIARNIQMLMKHEAHLDKVNDPASGSFYLENLTRELCTKAWAAFKDIEKRGGMLEAFKNAYIQDVIAQTAQERVNAAKEGRDIFIGINKFQQDTKAKERRMESASKGKYKALNALYLEDSI
jgi:methylmalonyl-CoA mutase